MTQTDDLCCVELKGWMV